MTAAQTSRLVSVWAEDVRRRYSDTAIRRDMLPGGELLEDYLLTEAALHDLAAALATEALLIDAQQRGAGAAAAVAGLLDIAPRLDSAGHVKLDADGNLSIPPQALGRLLLDARQRRAAAVARAAGEMTFLLADTKRRGECEVVRWWGANNSGYETKRRLAGRYTLGTLLGDAWRYRKSCDCLCVPAYIAGRLKVNAKGEVVSRPLVWKTLEFSALEFPAAKDGEK